jgi:hypothetical protein
MPGAEHRRATGCEAATNAPARLQAHASRAVGRNGVEDITYAYDPAALPADPFGQPFLVGAENSAGQGEMGATLPTEDLRVTTSDPSPGGTATYAVYVQGKKHGIGTVTTEMVAPAGTTVATTQIEILKQKPP